VTESPVRALIKSFGRGGSVASLTALVFLVACLLVACTDAVSGDEPTSTTAGVDEPSTTTTTETPTSTAPAEVTVTTTADFVRFIHPDEWTRIMESCMIDAGWPVTTTPDGGIEFPDRPEDQNPVLEADTTTTQSGWCHVSKPRATPDSTLRAVTRTWSLMEPNRSGCLIRTSSTSLTQ
jgi:hypothetical protein